MPVDFEAIKFQIDVAIDVEKILKIAKEAGDNLLEGLKNPHCPLPPEEQAGDPKDASLFSKDAIMDRCARGLVSMELTQIAPHIPIMSEDMKLVPHFIVKSYQYFWSFSIVDGEKTTAKAQNPQFAINIALVKGGVPLLGVVHMPYDNITHWAVKGRGAFVRVGTEGPGEPIKVRSFSECERGLPIATSSEHSSTETEAFCMQFIDPVMTSSLNAFNFMRVADGTAAMFPHLAKSHEWETAAAQVIVEEAGGIVVKYPEMTPLRYGNEESQNPPFVVYGNRLVPTCGDGNGHCHGVEDFGGVDDLDAVGEEELDMELYMAYYS